MNKFLLNTDKNIAIMIYVVRTPKQKQKQTKTEEKKR